MGNRMCRVIKRGCMAQAMKVPTFIYIQKRVFPMRTGTMVTKLIRTSPRICNCQSHVVGIEYHYNGTVLQNNRGRICVTTDIKINWSVVKFPRSFNIVRERNWKCIVFHRCVVDGSGRLVSPGVTIGDKCHHRIAPMPVTTLLILARRRPIQAWTCGFWYIRRRPDMEKQKGIVCFYYLRVVGPNRQSNLLFLKPSSRGV
mmetsp:Transcript_8429/g.15878  ORF Transcript_8429/g.15878 Transcript_8429/m.15878 type:complete len:200 (-) Transcript_8429:634-1233(-)